MSRRTARPAAPRRCTAGWLIAGLLVGAVAVGASDPSVLPERYTTWLVEVELLITDEERTTFLSLAEDYQRDAFIEAFWRQRDPDSRTGQNELRIDWQRRLAYARDHFGSIDDGRGRFLLANGEPWDRTEINCLGTTVPIEVWLYDGTDRTRWQFAVIFFQRWGVGRFRLWTTADGVPALLDDQSVGGTTAGCEIDLLWEALELIKTIEQIGGPFAYEKLIARLEQPPDPPSSEWVPTFLSYATDVPPDAATFDVTFEANFPSWHQSRTIVQGVIGVEAKDLGLADIRGHRSYNLLVNGEVLRGSALHERFRYRFDIPETEQTGDRVPLIFERYLRPGTYRLIARVEDLNSGALQRIDQPLEVPTLERPAAPPPLDPAVAEALAAANRTIAGGEASIRLTAPYGEVMTGLLRFDALVVGERVDQVRFAVDGREVLSKRTPPYSVELDFGLLPRTRRLRVSAHDAEGREIASDERLLNGSPHRFTVHLIDPVSGSAHRKSVRARVQVTVPEDEVLDRVEIFRDDERLATLFQPPFTQVVALPERTELTLIRALGHLADGTTAEDVAIVNGPPISDQIEVDFVELFTTVLDRDRRPVLGLEAGDFRVREDGRPQQLARFEHVRDVPIHATILLDVSASMVDRLPTARDAAVTFFEQLITEGGKDRLALITFNDRPTLAAGYANDLGRFAEGIAGLKAERGTALYDSLVYALFYANGLRGQRAILVLSDGLDENSRFALEDALEYAQRAAVTIYAVGLDLPSRAKSPARRILSRFAEETGGRSFFLDDIAGLDQVYATIRDELRSRYLLAYQSDNQATGRAARAFRRVEVEVDGRGLEVQALRGYYP